MKMLTRSSANFPHELDEETEEWIREIRTNVEELEQVTVQALTEAHDAVCSMFKQSQRSEKKEKADEANQQNVMTAAVTIR